MKNLFAVGGIIDPKYLKAFLAAIGLVLAGFVLGIKLGQNNILPQNPLPILSQSKDEVSVGQLKTMLGNKDFTFINVHIPYEGEIEKTDTFIPFDKVVENSASLPKDKNAPIILYCKTGRMSAEALETIKKLGYTNVRHLTGGMDAWKTTGGKLLDLSTVQNDVVPQAGVELPISWGDIGPSLVANGVIDLAKFKQAVKLTSDQEKILTQGTTDKIKIDGQNSQFIVDVLWALGLGQKSIIYTEGPMGKENQKDAGNFASTGGWTLAKGDAMNYLNRFDFVKLTPEQQKTVGEIAKNVYRPCCGNSTWFPDCNHGMAALAAIELMVAANVPEKDIYRNVLALNSYWFSDTYLTIATYFARQGTAWKDVDAKAVLGPEFSSGRGASMISQKVGPLPWRKAPTGGSCGA